MGDTLWASDDILPEIQQWTDFGFIITEFYTELYGNITDDVWLINGADLQLNEEWNLKVMLVGKNY